MTASRPKAELLFISVSDIQLNRDNPRGPNVRERDAEFAKLRESIRTMGILVPLVVQPKVSGGKKFLLVDGERRYHAAKSLKMEKVPAYVIDAPWDGKDLQLAMFHIHMNQRQWGASEQCKATEWLFSALLCKYKDPFSREIVRLYSERTGTVGRTARNRIQFLRWPEEIKAKVYGGKPEAYWYIVEIEDKIVEPARLNYPEYFDTVSIDEVRQFLYKKLEEGKVEAGIDVRKAAVITKSNVQEPKRRAEVLEILDNLVRDTNYSYAEAADSFERRFPEAARPRPMSPQRLANAIERLADQLSGYDEGYMDESSPRTRIDKEELIGALGGLIEAAQGLIDRVRGSR